MKMRDYIALAIEGRKTILMTLTVVLIIAANYLACTPRVYKTGALLRIGKTNATPPVNVSLDQEDLSIGVDNSRSQRVTERLRTRMILGKAVEDLNLMIQFSPRFFPLFGEILARKHDMQDGVSDAWWGFHRWAWGGEKLKIDVFDVPDRYLGKEFTLVALENGRFQLLDPEDQVLAEGPVGELLSVDVGKNERVMIKLAMMVARPETQFELVRRTSLATIETLQKAMSVKAVSQDSHILSIELKGRDPEQLAELVNDVASIYVSATTDSQSSTATETNNMSESQLAFVTGNLEEAKRALNEYQREHGAVEISAQAEELLNQASEMDVRRTQLDQKFKELSQHWQSDSPDIIAMGAQIERIDKNLLGLEKRIGDLPIVQQTNISLLRKVLVNSELVASISDKLREQNTVSKTAGNSRIISFAGVPDAPYWPQPGILLMVVSLVGVGLGIAVVLLRHSSQRHHNGSNVNETSIGLPLLATISNHKTQPLWWRLIRQITKSEINSPSSPDFQDDSVQSLCGLPKILKTTLSGSVGKVILVSCPVPGMGKSLISANVATLLASSRKRVLIIDSDNCNAYLPEASSIAKQPGLFDLLTGKNSLGDVIVSLPDSGVDIIPRGDLVTNAIELLVNGDLPEILEQLKSFYNHIVIDLPPVLEATDTAMLAKYCDVSFLVVKEGHYTTQELEASFRCFQQFDVTPNGFIINEMTEGTSYYPYYYKHNRLCEDLKQHENTPQPRDFMTGITKELCLVKTYLPAVEEIGEINKSFQA